MWARSPGRMTWTCFGMNHLEFALRHEAMNLEVIDAVFEHLRPEDLLARLNAAPTSGGRAVSGSG